MRLNFIFRINVFALLFIAFLVKETYSQTEEKDYLEPLQEVFQTELVFPQAKGEIQITLTPSFKDNDNSQITATKTAIEYGITDNFQVGLEFDLFTNLNPISGKSEQDIGGELELNTKYAFMNIGKKQLHIATFFAVSFPTGDIGLTEGFIEYQPFFLVAKDFPKLANLQLFSQIGGNFKQRVKDIPFSDEAAITAKALKKLKLVNSRYGSLIKNINHSILRNENHENNSDKESEFILNLGAFFPFRYATLVSEFNFIDGNSREAYFTPGIVFSLPKNFEIGIGIPIGLNKDSDNFRVHFNFIYEFNILKE